MEGGNILPQGSIAIVLLIKLLCSKDISADVRKGFFVNLDAESTHQLSSKSVLLKTVTAPSDLSCSHKCLANDQCTYKAFDPATKQCGLYQNISQVKVNESAIVSKKVDVVSFLKPTSSLSFQNSELFCCTKHPVEMFLTSIFAIVSLSSKVRVSTAPIISFVRMPKGSVETAPISY